MTAQVTVRASAVIPARSAVLRGPTERAVLDLMTARLAAVSLSGYIFFGSSVKISDQARTGCLICLLIMHILIMLENPEVTQTWIVNQMSFTCIILGDKTICEQNRSLPKCCATQQDQQVAVRTHR